MIKIIHLLLIIFYNITFVNCLFIGGIGYHSFYIDNKLYFTQDFLQFYVDLNGVALENNTIHISQWIFINDTPSYVVVNNPFVGGKANSKLFFVDKSIDGLHVDTFDAALSKWETNISYQGLPNEFASLHKTWVTNETNGISYTFEELEYGIIMFDTINYVWMNSNFSILNLKNLFSQSSSPDYKNYVPVLLSSGQILYIGGKSTSNPILMNRILAYDCVKDSWQIINTTGKTPEERIDHTAVLASHGRVIVYGGNNNLSIPATPIFGAPNEENSLGSLAGHTSVMVKNYMITAFGTNISGIDRNVNKIYKLDTSNILKYTWSFVSDFNNQSITISQYNNSSPISPVPPTQTNSVDGNTSVSSFNSIKSSTLLVVTILVIVVSLICLLILIVYKIKKKTNSVNN
ncbi:8347_t:CDS:2 [Gigaspora margarita]|uniref:8347_t:CDS:1 n=1 Tax=Gigaspora margarita TaxID=4874 RepID=A0ABN7V4D7_GIGMA|nr:8347_t:CDS:2 [Gigaspora margarita]